MIYAFVYTILLGPKSSSDENGCVYSKHVGMRKCLYICLRKGTKSTEARKVSHLNNTVCMSTEREQD